jgi:predicted MPP superfamily phosphohydrolase
MSEDNVIEFNRVPGTHWDDEEIEMAQEVLKFAESVQEAAGKLGVTPASLRKAFKRRNLPSPSEFIEELDMEETSIKDSIRVYSDKGWHSPRNLSNKKHLIIPDAHAKPGVDNDRFEWLGRYIYDEKPDVVVCIGDFADMESLSSYDKGKKSFEGRRYLKDIESAVDAQEKLFHWVNQMENKPRMVMCIGNHEARINRVSESSPEFDGLVKMEDLRYEEFGWETYKFLDRVVIDEICYSHFFTSGVMNRAISGEHPAASLIKKQYMSCTQGHSHTRDFAERTRADGKKMMGLVCGCYFEHDEHYATVANSLWWRGLVMKRHVNNGEYEPEFVPIEALKAKYGRQESRKVG